MQPIGDSLKISFQLTAQQNWLDIRAVSAFGEGHSFRFFPMTDLLNEFRKMHENAPLPILEALGAELYRILIDGEVAELAHKVLNDATKLQEPALFELRFDPDQVQLARFPWEIIFDKMGRFLVKEGQVDVVRYITYPLPPPDFDKDRISQPILRVFSSPIDLEPLQAVSLPITGPVIHHATFDQFVKTLLIDRQQLCGVHFDGHGGILLQCDQCGQLNFSSTKPCIRCGINLAKARNIGGLAFENIDHLMHLITAHDFGSVLYNAKMLFALLLACETANLSGDVVFNSLAPNLILAGIPVVIGMQFRVKDTFANRFAESFYHALKQDADILRAVRSARRMNLLGEWYSPVIYMRCQQKSAESEHAKSVHRSCNIDTATPTKVVAGKRFLVRLWIRRSSTVPLSDEKLRASLDIPASVRIQLEENQTKIELFPLEGSSLHGGEVDVTLSATGCLVAPEKIQLFVDDQSDAPAAIFTVQSQKIGSVALSFRVWQSDRLIVSIQHYAQVNSDVDLDGITEVQTRATVVKVKKNDIELEATNQTKEEVDSYSIQELEQAIKVAKQALAVLEYQNIGYTLLSMPANLRIALENKRKEVDRLETELKAVIESAHFPELEHTGKRYMFASVFPEIVILTVLQEEYQAVCDQFPNISAPPELPDFPNPYVWRIGEIPCSRFNRPYRVAIGRIARSDTKQGALALLNAVQWWNPRYVFFVGVASGLADLQKGDIIIADMIYGSNWSYATDLGLLTGSLAYVTQKDWHERMMSISSDNQQIKVHLGGITSSDKVVDNPNQYFFKQILRRWPKLKAVEKEGAGVEAAIQQIQAAGKAVGFMMIRGISDLPRLSNNDPTAGAVESDRWKPYAAKAAAAFSIGYIASGLPVPPR